MYLYAELWNTKPAWDALSPEEQGAYLDHVGPAIKNLTDAGVEIVGFTIDESDTPLSSGYRYLAVWKMNDKDQCEQLERTVEGAGWHEYFEQVNLRGPLLSPQQALADMVAGDGE